MANEKKTKKGYIYSKLSGFNIYDINLNDSDDFGVLEHFAITDIRAKSEKDYLAYVIYKTEEPISETRAAWFAEIIQNPVSNIFLEWPIDLIEVERSGKVNVCLIYRNNDYSHLKPIRELLYQPSMSRVLDWRNPFIITVCRHLLTAISALHSNGYIYNDFNIDNILYNPDTGEVFLKFTHNLRISGSKTKYDTVDCADISPEFAPPYVYNTDVYNGFLTEISDYYQITALLFKLMVGKLPYEGRDLMNYGIVFDSEFDTDENAHKYYFKHYHQYPHFIFDENDKTNSLSSTSDNDLPRERWNELPENVKLMFRNWLCQYTAEHPSTRLIPTPFFWLKVLSSMEAVNKKI